MTEDVSKSKKLMPKIYLRDQKLFNQFKDYLPPKGTLLDVGAGSCNLAELVSTSTKLEITPIDVVDHNRTDLSLVLYDGQKLPYKDNSFDVCLVVFVFHHAENIDLLLKEVIRVTKKRIIVIEDTPRNRFEHFTWEKWDYALNHAFHKDIDVAHRSLSSDQWKSIFKKSALKVVARKKFRSIFPVLGAYTHSLFVLDKKS
jgi:ubiquinone/menaquinone biosynthesis C-methylase UbiE